MNPGVDLARGRWNPGFTWFAALRDRAAAVVFAFDHDLVTRD